MADDGLEGVLKNHKAWQIIRKYDMPPKNDAKDFNL